MAVARYYASNAVDTTLSAGIGAGDTTMIVGSTSGFPGSYPYTLAIDYDTSNEELVDVTAANGTTLTITRAVDSTTAVSHASAANVKHVISGRDMRETQEHYNATGRYSVTNGTTTEYFNLHGIGLNEGNVVGTDKTQTLTAKTLTSPTINGATLGGTTTNSGTISGGTISNGTFTSPTCTGTVTLPSTTSIGNVSSTELQYVDGVTSAIQTQLDSKPTVKIQSGSTTTSSIASGSITTQPVTFTTAFSAGTTPVVTVTPIRSFNANTSLFQMTLNANPTNTGFVVQFINNTGATIALPFNWIAVGS